MLSNIFIGGGFPKQIHYINKIFIDKGHFDKIYTDDNNLYGIIPGVIVLFKGIPWKFFKFIFYIFIFPIFQLFFLVLLFIPHKTVFRRSLFFTQLLHSYWDTSIVIMKDGQIRPTINQKFYAVRNIFNHSLYSLYLKLLGINHLLLGHSVYGSRVLIAFGRLFGFKIYTFANWNYQLQSSDIDIAWWQINNSNLNSINEKEAIEYFCNRILGQGLYEDSNNVLKKNSEINISEDLPKNILFLHIFKDSAFNVIDTNRIFRDYFEWIIITLTIIGKSKEKWSLRMHPSAQRWGEDQEKTVKIIFDYVKNNYDADLKNVLIENPSQRTNVELLNSANKIVTFNGTIHLEAICFGIKPIVISDVMISRTFPDLVFKPNDLNEYANLLLEKINTSIDESNTNLGKKILLLREKYIPFNSVLKSFYTYRGDPKEKFDNAVEHLKIRTQEEHFFLQNQFEAFFRENLNNTNSKHDL